VTALLAADPASLAATHHRDHKTRFHAWSSASHAVLTNHTLSLGAPVRFFQFSATMAMP